MQFGTVYETNKNFYMAYIHRVIIVRRTECKSRKLGGNEFSHLFTVHLACPLTDFQMSFGTFYLLLSLIVVNAGAACGFPHVNLQTPTRGRWVKMGLKHPILFPFFLFPVFFSGPYRLPGLNHSLPGSFNQFIFPPLVLSCPFPQLSDI